MRIDIGGRAPVLSINSVIFKFLTYDQGLDGENAISKRSRLILMHITTDLFWVLPNHWPKLQGGERLFLKFWRIFLNVGKQVTRIAKDQIPHLETLESDSEVVIFKVEEDLFEITSSVQALIECNRSKYETSSRHPGQCRRFLSPILSNSLVLQISLALCYRYVLLIPRRKSWGDAKEMDRFNKGRSKYSSGAVTTIGNWVLVLAF